MIAYCHTKGSFAYIGCWNELLDEASNMWAVIRASFYDCSIGFWSCSYKSLKIPKGQSETVYRRRTDNTMT